MSHDIKTLFSLLLDESDKQAEEKVLQHVDVSHIHSYLGSSGDYLIHLAARRGMTDLVTQLIKLGANPYGLNHHQKNALSLAYKGEHHYTVAAIYRSKIPVTSDIGPFFIGSVKNRDIKGLALYCKKAGPEVTRQALNAWVSGEHDNSMLHLAARLNDGPMLDYLLSQGANPHYQNREGKTPFDLITDSDLLAKLKPTPPKTQPSQPMISLPVNPYQANYLEFTRYLKSKKYNEDDYVSLGAVAMDSPEYYFKQGQKSLAYAQTFLNRLWSDNEARELLLQQQNDKVKRADDPECTPLFPSCLSFIVITIQSKEYCLVATSLYNKPMFNKLTAVTNQLGQNFLLLHSRQSDLFNDLMTSLMGTDYVVKRCTEKSYSRTLAKLFLMHGRQLTVSDVCNTLLYPYHRQEFYGNHPKATVKSVTPPFSWEKTLALANDFYTGLIPCCPLCQTNKPFLLHLYKAAQDYGQQYVEGKQPRRDLSPLRHSTKSYPGFFEGRNEQSVVTRNALVTGNPSALPRKNALKPEMEPKKMPSI